VCCHDEAIGTTKHCSQQTKPANNYTLTPFTSTTPTTCSSKYQLADTQSSIIKRVQRASFTPRLALSLATVIGWRNSCLQIAPAAATPPQIGFDPNPSTFSNSKKAVQIVRQEIVHSQQPATVDNNDRTYTPHIQV
jgi:hypothetical protein